MKQQLITVLPIGAVTELWSPTHRPLVRVRNPSANLWVSAGETPPFSINVTALSPGLATIEVEESEGVIEKREYLVYCDEAEGKRLA